MKDAAGRIATLAVVIAGGALAVVVLLPTVRPPSSGTATRSPGPSQQAPSSSVGSEPTNNETASPACCEPTDEQTAMQPPSATPTPLTGLAGSDAFWDPLAGIGLLWRYEYSGLADIVDNVDLAVVGTITDVQLEPRQVGPHLVNYIRATVDVEEVLKGEPLTREPGTVSVSLGRAGESWETISEDLPNHRHVFFLMNDAAELEREGEPIEDEDYSTFTYWRPNDQAVLREIDGEVAVVGEEHMLFEYGSDRFPYPLHGTSFSELVDQIRLGPPN